MFGKKISGETMVEDESGWLHGHSLADFALMHTDEIKFMCMFGYTFLHGERSISILCLRVPNIYSHNFFLDQGCKVFGTISPSASFSYKFVSMVLACLGGGILVPIFLNKIPVALAMDAYPIAITISFFLHYHFPVLREVVSHSPIVYVSMKWPHDTSFVMTPAIKSSPCFPTLNEQGGFAFLYEVTRAAVVVKFTGMAGEIIPASDFSFPVFGPIFCGTISGCGGAFLPFSKGLEPIRAKGLASPMYSALVGATFYHLFMFLYSEGIKHANRKAHFVITVYFVLNHFHNKWGVTASVEKVADPVKKES